MKALAKWQWLLIAVVGILIGATVSFFYVPAGVSPRLTIARFELEQYISPTAARAQEIGDTYLDAAYHPALYSRSRAQYFFLEALRLDSTRPESRHQLARVAFLDGDLPSALWYVDREINLEHSIPSASSYYLRGLIKGYMGNYTDAAKDYKIYLKSDPTNWAAINDYAWVLLKDRRYEDAFTAIKKGLSIWPENPWLLNSASIALYEMKDARAKEYSLKALHNVGIVTDEEWRTAYPGNDPAIAAQGIKALSDSVIHNDERIRAGRAL